MNYVSQIAKSRALEKRVPRYTSYPPANHFNGSVNADCMAGWLAATPAASRISLYVHIPFCRNLCWFCACRTQGIRRRVDALHHYVDGLKVEIDRVAGLLDPSIMVKSLHLGGGTPTLLPPPLMIELLEYLKTRFRFVQDYDLAVEIDPTEIDQDRMDVLIDAGLSRASVGVQDFNPLIQKAIGRPQSFEQTKDCFDMLRKGQVKSINIDLLYGLPNQTPAGFRNTLEKVLALNPDRVAMFGYAHVPWMARRQKLIDAATLPCGDARYLLLETGRQLFANHGYEPVGIDHFANPQDQLVKASRQGQLRRNFQGYTDDQSRYLIGLGASAISSLPQGYAQNTSGTQAYLEMIRDGALATSRGHRFSDEDQLRGYVIEQLMCRFRISLDEIRQRFGTLAELLSCDITRNARKIGLVRVDDGDGREVYEIAEEPHLTARLVAQYFDQYVAPEKSHGLAV
ncbi:oxygen-independent coproporphyrinogen III oxidase [Alphaproteobacteria bacterium LSUCC0684]